MKFRYLIVLLVVFQFSTHGLCDEPWLIGQWELVYDPHDAEKDWLEFLPNGDVISTGKNGKIEGIYILTPAGVKAVLTFKGKDVILNFTYDKEQKALKIITSHTGRASIYKRTQ